MHDFCFKKLEHLISRIGHDKTKTICHDLIFAERFRYKYLNPVKLNTPTRGSIFGEDQTYVKIKLVIVEVGDGTVHSRVRKFGPSHADPSRQYGIVSVIILESNLTTLVVLIVY